MAITGYIQLSTNDYVKNVMGLLTDSGEVYSYIYKSGDEELFFQKLKKDVENPNLRLSESDACSLADLVLLLK